MDFNNFPALNPLCHDIYIISTGISEFAPMKIFTLIFSAQLLLLIIIIIIIIIFRPPVGI